MVNTLIASDAPRLPIQERIAELEKIDSLSNEELLVLANSKAHPITETFYSFQGEGARTGRAVYFVRYSKCNFRCSWCDSKRTWNNKDTKTADELLALIEGSPAKAVVITGGEPMIYRHQEWFVAFVVLLKRLGYEIEVESDAFAVPPPILLSTVHQWNLSPKLGTSGIKLDDKYFAAIAEWSRLQREHDYNIWFKFVVADEGDFREVQQFEQHFNLTRGRIFLMAEGNTIEAQMKNMPYVVDRALVGGYNFAPRVHILVWNDKEAV